ncbi:hypothetical protein VB779_08660 [Haloarculaceae archaeon H-GB11]|nr:hypothetical protein [Haloarculaceae archaeon H-GB11]
MPRLRYTGGGTYRVGGYGFEAGEENNVDGELAEYLADHDDFEEVDGADADGGQDDAGSDDAGDDVTDGPGLTASDSGGESKPLPFNPEEHTNDEVADKVADIDDVETLQALRNLEEDQQDRTGATDAIDDRLDELEG